MRLVADLLSRRVEGIVIAPEGDDHRHLGPGPMHGTPVVFVARPPSGISADCVLVDDFAGTKDATGRLIARGHTNIAFVGLPPTVWSGAERFRGFAAAMADAQLRLNKRYVRYQQSDVMADVYKRQAWGSQGGSTIGAKSPAIPVCLRASTTPARYGQC